MEKKTKKQIATYLTPEQIEELKIIAMVENKPLCSIIEQAVINYIEENPNKELAKQIKELKGGVK